MSESSSPLFNLNPALHNCKIRTTSTRSEHITLDYGWSLVCSIVWLVGQRAICRPKSVSFTFPHSKLCTPRFQHGPLRLRKKMRMNAFRTPTIRVAILSSTSFYNSKSETGAVIHAPKSTIRTPRLQKYGPLRSRKKMNRKYPPLGLGASCYPLKRVFE